MSEITKQTTPYNKVSKAFDKFFGTGYWEKQYKPHIVNFALICLKESDHRQQLEEVIEQLKKDYHESGDVEFALWKLQSKLQDNE